MLRLRILRRGAKAPFLDRPVSAKALTSALDDIKRALARLKDGPYTVVADNGEVYSILWRTVKGSTAHETP